MRTTPTDTGIIHFTGIGGIGMSGIAEVLLNLGYKVHGSDISENSNVLRLREKGASINIGHCEENLHPSDGEIPSVVVISSAISSENPEITAARKLKIPIVKRADMLAELMRLKFCIAVAGTHGKTTTTSMVGTILEKAKMDPTVINGGIINAYGTNTRMGASDWMVVEADESDGTFTRLPATIGIVTNIDPEHMEHYGNIQNLRKSFRQFIDNIPFYGFAVLCMDHPEVQSLIASVTDRKIITYGTSPQSDIQAQNIRVKEGVSLFDLRIDKYTAENMKLSNNSNSDIVYRDLKLPVLGQHNILNSMAATAVGLQLGIKFEDIKPALEEFSGVKRRFTKTGTVNGVTFIDDYGHHPVEIRAVLKAGRMATQENGGKIIAVVQPHRYSRLQSLFDDFCKCFHDADSVIVSDVYPAGEKPIEGYDKQSLARGIADFGHRDVQALISFEELPKILKNKSSEGDYVIFLGAGDITKWANLMPKMTENIK